MEEDYQNVFQKACLIQLSTGIWMGSKMLDQTLMTKVSQNSEWLRGRKFLINPELLGPLHTSAHQARNLVQQYSLPFPITSLYLIPKESLAFVDERLAYQKALFQEKTKAFIGTYELAISEAKKNLGNLFNAMDYPVDITSKFKFEWRFLTLDIPGKGSILSPEVYEREKGKFLDMMEEARTMSAVALREEFADIVTSLVDKLNSGTGQAYPAVDVLSELRRMETWATANPVHRKSNWQRFIVNWLTSSQDRALRGGPNGPPEGEGSLDRWLKKHSTTS